MELRRKSYKTKKETNEGEDGEDVVGWGRHLVCRPVAEARVLGKGGAAAFFSSSLS
jgi:hypothetical protein